MSANLNTTSMSCSTKITVKSPFASISRRICDGAVGLLDRQALRRLVQHQEPRLLRDRHRDLQQPLVTMRKQPGLGSGKPRKTHLFERLVGDFSRCCENVAAGHRTPTVGMLGLRGDSDVFARRQIREEMRELKSTRDTLLDHPINRETRDPFAGKVGFALRGGEHARDDVEERRLAGTVRTDDGANLARFDCHIDAVDGDEAAKAARQPAAFKKRHG